MPKSAPPRLQHFLVPLALVAAAVVVALLPRLSEFFVSLFNVLPTLALLLGGLLCLAYARVREAALLVSLYLAYYLLDDQIDLYRSQGVPGPQAALIYHLGSLLLPLLYGLYACWRERSQLLQDLLLRAAVLGVVLGLASAVGNAHSAGWVALLADAPWPALYGRWMGVGQLAVFAYIGVLLALVIQYLRAPRPLHAACLVVLAGMFWMWPRIFLLPHALGAMTSLGMLALVAALAHEAYLMAYRDELTGLPGRRALNERLQRLPRQYVIAMCDVDHFKRFNDTHGHDVGDQVLKLVAAQLRRVGGGGRAYRWGGEEFTLLFPGRDLDECLAHLERVRRVVANYRIQLRDRERRPSGAREGRELRGKASGEAVEVSVTISIGVAERSERQRTPEAVVKAADQALYGAKSAGRDRVFVHGANRSGAVRVTS